MMTVEEYAYARARARRPVKVTLPSPLMLFLVWSPQRSRDAYSDPFELFADGLRLMRRRRRSSRGWAAAYIQVDAPDFGQLVDPAQRDAWEPAGIPSTGLSARARTCSTRWRGFPASRSACTSVQGQLRQPLDQRRRLRAISKQLFQRATNYDTFLLEYETSAPARSSRSATSPDDKVVVLGLVSTRSSTGWSRPTS